MTPVERLQAAIEKLEAVRDYPVPAEVEAAMLEWAKRGFEDARAAWLIVALTNERAIDAQLAILRRGVAIEQVWGPSFGNRETGKSVLALADAILGSDS